MVGGTDTVRHGTFGASVGDEGERKQAEREAGHGSGRGGPLLLAVVPHVLHMPGILFT